jgi:choline-sulfatase
MMNRLFNSERLKQTRQLIGLIACATACACGGSGDRAALRHDSLHRANVLLVTIDTLRVDRLGVYGNKSGLTPVLDTLANAGVRYSRATSHAPMTLPAHTSILTGLSPRRSGVRNNTTFRLDDGVPTVATFLKSAGYRTGAFVGAFVLDSRFGLAKNFDVYDERLPHTDRASFHFAERRGDAVVKAAEDWILGQSPIRIPQSAMPWFAWVHLFDPHAPYDAPAEFRTGRTPYDAEVAYADAMVGRLIDALRVAGQLEHTLVVVTADHGESLGDHGETTHGLFAYEATLHVPLIVSGPSVGRAVVNRGVAHVDIVPTILDLVGLPIPSGLEGQSLADPIPADRALYFEALDAYLTRGWAPLKGVVQDGWKYIDLPEAELYDLSSDPDEAHNLVERSERAGRMQGVLADLESRGSSAAPAVPLDAEAAARLRSLGYTAGSTGTRSAPTVKDDPKRLVALNEKFNTALTAFEEGRAQEALAGFMSVLSARPDFVTARTSAATVLIAQRRIADAVRLLREAPENQRDVPQILAKLGTALQYSGDLSGAAAAFEQAHRLDEGNADVLEDLGVVYAAQHRMEDARRIFNEGVKRNPLSATAWFNLGLFELQSGRPDAAAAALRRAVEREPSYGDAWNALGASLARTDPEAALDAWRHAESLLPRDYDLLFNLGILTAQGRNPQAAIPYLQRFIAEAPRDRYAADVARVQTELMRLQGRQ